MNDQMDNKKRIYIGLAAVSAVLLICVVLVGMIDGVWPWEPGNGIINQWFDPDFGKVDETTGSTEESTEQDTPETTEGQTEEGGNKKPSKPSDNDNVYEEPTIGLEVGTPDGTTGTEDTTTGTEDTTTGTEDTTTGTDGEEDGPQTVVDEEGNTGINFKDLWDKLHGGN